MKQCVQRYLDIAPGVRLRNVDTPFLPEDQHFSPHEIPAADAAKAGGIIECTWCKRSMPADVKVYSNAD